MKQMLSHNWTPTGKIKALNSTLWTLLTLLKLVLNHLYSVSGCINLPKEPIASQLKGCTSKETFKWMPIASHCFHQLVRLLIVHHSAISSPGKRGAHTGLWLRYNALCFLTDFCHIQSFFQQLVPQWLLHEIRPHGLALTTHSHQ